MYTTRQLGKLLDAVAGNAAVGLRTTAVQACDGSSRFRWTAKIADWVGATHVTIAVYASVDGGATYGRIQSQAVSAGVATLSDYTQSNPVSGNESFDGWVDCLGATHIYAIIAATGGVAAEKLTFIPSLAQVKR